MLLGDLGVTKSFRRPHVSDDNPFSESQFKTLKYRPDFPNDSARFKTIAVSAAIFRVVQQHHYHSALALLTPEDVHYGRAEQIIGERQRVLDRFYEEHPERFVNGPPKHPVLAAEVWINPPPPKTTREVAPGATFETSDDLRVPQFSTLTAIHRCRRSGAR